jgi:hypothetical protein
MMANMASILAFSCGFSLRIRSKSRSPDPTAAQRLMMIDLNPIFISQVLGG